VSVSCRHHPAAPDEIAKVQHAVPRAQPCRAIPWRPSMQAGSGVAQALAGSGRANLCASLGTPLSGVSGQPPHPADPHRLCRLEPCHHNPCQAWCWGPISALRPARSARPPAARAEREGVQRRQDWKRREPVPAVRLCLRLLGPCPRPAGRGRCGRDSNSRDDQDDHPWRRRRTEAGQTSMAVTAVGCSFELRQRREAVALARRRACGTWGTPAHASGELRPPSECRPRERGWCRRWAKLGAKRG
jgi:hypothetical protein